MNDHDKLIEELVSKISGEVYSDDIYRIIYSTDASAYKEKPVAIVIPKIMNDIRESIVLATKYQTTLIPRTAGTSISGQVVGSGIIVDCSKYLTRILEVNQVEKWVRVEPGVVLDELNMVLKKDNLFFGPETSTSNRCMIGGMVGNNSCGAHSLIYGSTRSHVLEIKGFLSDGSEVCFKKLTKSEFASHCEKPGLEGKIYRQIRNILKDENNRERIREEYPDVEIERRNTGYALDLLLDSEPFVDGGYEFNFCKLICASEGTLVFITEIKLSLVDIPSNETGLLAAHFDSVEQALEANIIALKYKPVAIELIDNYILECTKKSREHSKNRFFLEGEPGALLCIEFSLKNKEQIESVCRDLVNEFKSNGYGYHYPLIFGSDINRVWALRKAGLGLLANVPGDAKPQPVIEDTAVNPLALPDYIKEFNQILAKYDLQCVYYAHIATGELHLRPVINLKTVEGIELFHTIALEVARLVKKYRGSLSGEHGDGRLRGEFIPIMIGQENYELLKDIKNTWDPHSVFNKGKIIETPPMDSSLRYSPGQSTPEYDTILDFSESKGILRLAEQCNGSADCRKSFLIGGTMCPSYQATRDENTTTRARANLLREILTNSSGCVNPFNNKELFSILDLCLSCKGCKSECPSSVDMAKLKAEFLYQYYKSNRIPLRTLLIANYSKLQSFAVKANKIYNAVISNKFISGLIKKMSGFALKRSLPSVNSQTFYKWLKKNLDLHNQKIANAEHSVYLFIDEFTNYNDAPAGIAAVKLLTKLGYRVKVVKHKESGRAYISKGLLVEARKIARFNVNIFINIISGDNPLIGIEPSAILAFRDEYPDLLRGSEKAKAIKLAKNTYTFEEFISKEAEHGHIRSSYFTKQSKKLKFHGHCQQKAVSTTDATRKMLELPENYSVEEIKSGCCGMAGSFGYEKEHFDLSMKIGEMILFPAIRSAEPETIIVAAGTSCRHQIKDGTNIRAYHPIEVLYDALLNKN